MNPFQAAIAAAQDTLAAVNGVRVTLRRGTAETANVLATPGRTQFTVGDSEGARLRQVVRDYLIVAADYQFDGVASDPRAGDTLTETLPDGRERVYEVAPLAPGGELWHWSDNFARRLRIHTVDITPAPAAPEDDPPDDDDPPEEPEP